MSFLSPLNYGGLYDQSCVLLRLTSNVFCSQKLEEAVESIIV
jgi:hypothetical protein